MSSANVGFRRTSFFNPETLRNNHWLHYWGIKSTSPFKQAVVFTTTQPSITSVTVSPSTATLAAGQVGILKLSATVVTAGFANKAVVWTVDSTSAADGVTITQEGLLTVPADVSVESVTVTATSVFDKTKDDDATITIASSESQADDNTNSNT